MSGTFKGFTDKDIEKMKSPIDMNKRAMKNVKRATIQNIPTTIEPTIEKPIVVEEPSDIDVSLTMKSLNEVEAETNNNSSSNESLENSNSIAVDTDPYLSVVKPIDMEAFQLQQKLIEEQNRKRKEMLAKALDDRAKKNAEEVIRLGDIKKELQSLDLQLSGDVSMLRKQIDKCSLSFMEAEKNYHKIEMEFLAAKINLQKERERKELLTEHLCTLIAHNESRKAKKLEFLMDKLVYEKDTMSSSNVVDGVCELTGKMIDIENESNLTGDN